MTIKQKMLTVAASAVKLLDDNSLLVAEFFRRHFTRAGGFVDRAGADDLYYTVFGMEGLTALGRQVNEPMICSFVEGFLSDDFNDLAGLASYINCWSSLKTLNMPTDVRDAAEKNLRKFTSTDGAFNIWPRAPRGSAYGCFLALNSFEYLQMDIPNKKAMLKCLCGLRTDDGGYSNDTSVRFSAVPAAAAAVMTQYSLGQLPDERLFKWFMSCFKHGGFTAIPQSDRPDLLSTATAVHCLAQTGADLSSIRDECIEFVMSLMTDDGGFCASTSDRTADCEYTYYGLLALGNLSL